MAVDRMTTLDMTLGQVRDLVEEGVIFGHSDFHCRSIRPLDSAEAQDFACVEAPEQFDAASSTRAGALLVPEALGGVDAHQLVVPNPRATLERLRARLEEDAAAGRKPIEKERLE